MAEEKLNRQVNFLDCRPVIMDAVCACGEKCFHEANFIFEDNEGNPIPPDACPISCIATNLEVNTDDIVRVPGTIPGSLGCFEVTGTYVVRVVFEVGAQDVRMATATFDFTVNVPIDTDYGCVLCNGNETEFCLITRVFQCISANLVEVDGAFAVRVIVEKQFFVLEQGQTLICLPVCPIDECNCIPPGPVAGEECIPFEREPVCDEWCYEDAIDCPDVCSECPPPQTDEDECVDD